MFRRSGPLCFAPCMVALHIGRWHGFESSPRPFSWSRPGPWTCGRLVGGIPSGKLTVCELENHRAIFMGKSTIFRLGHVQ